MSVKKTQKSGLQREDGDYWLGMWQDGLVSIYLRNSLGKWFYVQFSFIPRKCFLLRRPGEYKVLIEQILW